MTLPAPWQAEPKVTSRARSVAAEHVGRRSHASRYEHRLAHISISVWDFASAGAEGPCCTFAVHVQALALSIHIVLLDLGHVVGHIVDQIQLRFREISLKDLSRPVGDDMPVGPGVVCGADHGSEVIVGLGRAQGGAGKLLVGNVDIVLFQPPGSAPPDGRCRSGGRLPASRSGS